MADEEPQQRSVIGSALDPHEQGACSAPELRTFYCGFTGAIDSHSATRIGNALNYANNNGFRSVVILFSSPGGIIADGVYLYNLIRGLPVNVTMHAAGTVASIAMAIFVGAARRTCSRHATFMAHPTSLPSGAEGWTWERLKSTMEAAIAEDNRIEEILRERCAIPDDILAGRRFREVHLTAEKAVEFGVAGAIEEFKLPAGAIFNQV